MGPLSTKKVFPKCQSVTGEKTTPSISTEFTTKIISKTLLDARKGFLNIFENQCSLTWLNCCFYRNYLLYPSSVHGGLNTLNWNTVHESYACKGMRWADCELLCQGEGGGASSQTTAEQSRQTDGQTRRDWLTREKPDKSADKLDCLTLLNCRACVVAACEFHLSNLIYPLPR